METITTVAHPAVGLVPHAVANEREPLRLAGLIQRGDMAPVDPDHHDHADDCISNRLVSGGRDTSGWRLPAEALEAAVSQTIIAHLTHAAERHRFLEAPEAREMDAVSSAVMACVRILELLPDPWTDFRLT